MEIEQFITLPESKTLEFKRDLSSVENILKTIVAFANTAGGIIIIGRSTDGVRVVLVVLCRKAHPSKFGTIKQTQIDSSVFSVL